MYFVAKIDSATAENGHSEGWVINPRLPFPLRSNEELCELRAGVLHRALQQDPHVSVHLSSVFG